MPCLAPYTSSPTTCPAFDSRQQASAFNQQLSFDTSSVTDMFAMFYVRSSPCPAPISAVIRALSCTLRTPRSPAASRLCQPVHLAPHRMPPFESRQAASAFNQPLTFDASSVTDMADMFLVRSRSCPAPESAVVSSPARCLCAPRSLASRPAARLQLAPHRTPLIWLGRLQAPCPAPTSCSSVAHGRVIRPSPPLAMARVAGGPEAARRRLRRLRRLRR